MNKTRFFVNYNCYSIKRSSSESINTHRHSSLAPSVWSYFVGCQALDSAAASKILLHVAVNDVAEIVRYYQRNSEYCNSVKEFHHVDFAFFSDVNMAQRDSPWGSMRRGQRTFWPDNKECRHTCLVKLLST